jgi:hypothetical protein
MNFYGNGYHQKNKRRIHKALRTVLMIMMITLPIY